MAVGSGTQEFALRHVHNTVEETKCTCASSTVTEPTAKILSLTVAFLRYL